MKITFVLPPLYSYAGGERVTLCIIEGLCKRGHELTLVCNRAPGPGLKERIRKWLRGQVFSPPTKDSEFVRAVAARCRVIDTVGDIGDERVPDADVVVATWWRTADYVAGLSARKGAKVYYVQDYGAASQPMDELKRTWDLPLYKITLCQWMKELLLEHRDEEIVVVPNGIDLDQFSTPPRHMPEVPTVGFLYTTHVEKGIDICIEAVRRARERLPNLRVVAFGSKKPAPELPLPEGTDFRFCPPDEVLPELYGACTVWLFGSRREGFGLPLLESMACRTPVIATPAAYAPEIVNDQRGRLVPHEDPEAMANAIVELCNLSKSEWEHMSEACREAALPHTWDDAVAKFEKALVSAVTKQETAAGY